MRVSLSLRFFLLLLVMFAIGCHRDKKTDDAEVLPVDQMYNTAKAALVENMAREDLNPVDAARAVAALVEELGLTREDVGRRVGRSTPRNADHGPQDWRAV